MKFSKVFFALGLASMSFTSTALWAVESCEDAQCPTGYRCVEMSGRASCVRNDAPPPVEHASCNGAVCPTNYHCEIVSDVARCVANFNSDFIFN
jgi:hypothetical protein